MKTVFPADPSMVKEIVTLTRGIAIVRDGVTGVRYLSHNECKFYFPCFVEDGPTIGFNLPTNIVMDNRFIYEMVTTQYTETSYSALWNLLKVFGGG